MMKFVYALFFLNVLSARAQINDKPVKLVHYAFDSFTNGKVVLKSKEVSERNLNYNLLTKEMIFEQGGKYLAIAYPELVDTVYISATKFIPVNNAFYEYLGGSKYPLFIEHTCTIKEQGANTGFGNTNTTASTPLKSLITDGGAYRLQLPDEFKIIRGQSLYIRKDGQYYKANNEQQMIKLFPDKKQLIKDWIKNNNTRFSRPQDMILLVQQIQ